MPTFNISRTKYVKSIDISHIFRSKYCFFSIRTRGLSCVMRSLVSICAWCEILNWKETIYTYKKASVMGKFTREISYKKCRKFSSSNVEVNPSNVSNIPPDRLFVTLLETWIHHPGPSLPLQTPNYYKNLMCWLIFQFWITPPHTHTHTHLPHTRTRPRSQWRQRLRLLHSLAFRERHVHVAIERQFV